MLIFRGIWTELSCGWHQHLMDMLEISQGKQQMKLLRILEQSSVWQYETDVLPLYVLRLASLLG